MGFKPKKKRNQEDRNATPDGADESGKRILVNDFELGPLEARPPLVNYLGQLYQRRHFIHLDAKSRAFSSNQDMIFGRLWIILQPLLEAAMYGFLFGYILKTSAGIENFVGYLVIGITYFGFITTLMNSGNGLIKSSRGMIASFRFPKAALVLSSSYRAFLDSLPSAVMAILVALVMQYQSPISWKIVLVIPVFLMLHMFGTGLMFLTARITAQIPDVRVLIQVGTRAWFFISGAFFSIERFVDQPQLKAIMQANPAYIFLQAIRNPALYNEIPPLSVWVSLIAWSFGTFIVGFLVFWQAEDRYINVR